MRLSRLCETQVPTRFIETVGRRISTLKNVIIIKNVRSTFLGTFERFLGLRTPSIPGRPGIFDRDHHT